MPKVTKQYSQRTMTAVIIDRLIEAGREKRLGTTCAWVAQKNGKGMVEWPMGKTWAKKKLSSCWGIDLRP